MWPIALLWDHFKMKLFFQFFFVKIRFSESNIWWFYIRFGLSIFWSIWNDSPCKTLVDVASKLWWFWTLLYVSNFYITFVFTNVTWTRRTISFIGNTWFVRNKETKGRIFQFLNHCSWICRIFNKCFDLILFEFTVGYFNGYEMFCHFRQTWWNYKTFISTFFTLLKLINYTVSET